jgi:predicted RNase H-like HicB family nuclease
MAEYANRRRECRVFAFAGRFATYSPTMPPMNSTIMSGIPRGVSAYVPDLPGCVAAGETVEEVRGLIQGAIRLHLAGLQEDGEPVPEPSSQVEYVEAWSLDGAVGP